MCIEFFKKFTVFWYINARFIFYSLTEPVLNFRGPRIFYLVVTVIIQFYCNAHIVVRKWQLYTKDKRSVPLRLVQVQPIRNFLIDNPIQDDTNERRNIHPIQHSTPRLNNIAYNKIIAEVGHIIWFFVNVLFFLLVRAYLDYFITDLDTISIISQSKIKLYILDFGPQLLVSFIFPLIFYFSHKELRIYWKNYFRCRWII